MPSQTHLITFPSGIPSQSLWHKALETLDEEFKTSFDFKEATHGDILSAALKVAQEKKQVCVQKRWTLKKRNGEIIILRDVVEKIIVWVEKFIVVGDAAMQYDPGHAAPAWAAFRFVLQVAVNDKRVFGEMLENLETISHLITRYAMFEDLYLQRNSAARAELKIKVISLYAEVLTFLGKARKYFQTSTRIRVATSILKFSEDEQMAKITILESQVSKLAELVSAEIQRDTEKSVAAMSGLLASLDKPIKRLIDQSNISAQVLQNSKHLELLRWLSPVPFSSHHKRHSENRIPGSGEWLLNHPQYLTWRNTSSSLILLLHGILGSGKTSLTSAVVDSFLQESSGQAPPAPIAYFYCAKSQAEAERTDPDAIMRSILRQLTINHGSKPKVHDRILREYERREAEAEADGFDIPKLRVHECVRLILDTTGANPATIVVDAVDEIQASCRHELLSALTQITKESASVVKVFVTSRDDSNVYALLPNALTVRIQSQNSREDMELFVRHEVSLAIQHRRMLNGSVSDDLRENLTQTLIAGAGEMFIWAGRQIENLSRMKLEADIRNAMRKLPKETLNDLYEGIFSRISKAEPQACTLAIQAFSLLLCTQEPLSPKAFLQAMATTTPHHYEAMDLLRMMDICFNLIVLDSELKVLRFAHVSFQEFLEMRAEFAPHRTHRVAAVSCLELCQQGFPIGMEATLVPKDNFYHYSAVYWAKHCRATDVIERDDIVIGKLEEFVFDKGDIALPFLSWLEELPKFSKQLTNDHPLAKDLRAVIHSGGSPLFTACVFGLSSLVDTLALTTDFDWNQKNDLGQTGLYLAAAAGHKAIVQKLLQYAPDVNPLGGKFNHPLHAACFAGYVPIVKLLLDHGADPTLGPKNALECSFLGGHENITLMLLENNFEISDQADYDLILRQAAEVGYTEVLRFLQDKYAFLFGDLGSPKCKAIEAAIFKGRTGVLERQIRKAANPKTDLPSDAVAIAALGGQDVVIKLLIDNGLDIDREGPFGTPLRAASIMCHESTVQLLLKLGARLDVSGSLGDSLQAAAMRGHEPITKMLLNEGANVNRHGGFYGTALQAAAYRGHQRIVEILLDAGADVHQGGFSRDSFHAASEGGHENIVRLFLERGFKVQHTLPEPRFRESGPSPYKNLLREASPGPAKDFRCASGNQFKLEGWRERASALDFHYVFESMRETKTPEREAIQPYREHYRHHSGGEENYALQAAAASGHYSVVELLLAHVHTMGISNSEIMTAFKEACKNGHQKVVKLLLTSHMEVKDLKTSLEAAALHGHLAVVNMLIDYEEKHGLARTHSNGQNRFDLIGAVPNSSIQETFQCDLSVQLIWMAGCEGGQMPIVKRAQELAAQRCTAIEMRHLYGDALYRAATHHNFDVVKALLDSGTDFNLKELSQMVDAVCDWGNVPALRLLLEYDRRKLLGPHQYSRGFDKAARKGKHEVVHFLLGQSFGHHDLTIDAETIIHVSGNGFMSVLRPLIENTRTQESFPGTLNQSLQIASQNGHKEVVDFLIREGADVNAVVEVQHTNETDRFGACGMSYDRRGSSRKRTALQAALLGFRRFNPQSRHDYLPFGRTSWQSADASSQEQTIQLLLTKGANTNELAGYERYPLHIAASYCSAEIVRLLIATGANANASTQQHGTAIRAAAYREVGAVPVIKVLLEAGGAISQNDDGIKAALNEALSFFGDGDQFHRTDGDGQFQILNSPTDLLINGPGAVVKILLDCLPEETADDSRYSLLFQMACMAGDRQCVELLLQRRIDVNRSGCYYGTGLQAASRVGNMDIIETLLNAGADVNILQGAHGTALRAAVLGGHEHVVGFLILHGADINLCYTNRDQSILHLALETGNRAIYKILLAAGADVNKDMPNQQPIMISASKFGDATLVELLLASGADVNIPGKALGRHASVSYDEASPLHAACAEGHESVVQFLLAHGADTEKIVQSSGTPLQAAIRGNHLSVVRLLLDAGANVDQGSYHSPLSEASRDGKLEIVEELLKAGACIGDPPTVRNALATACTRRQHAVSELLFEALCGTEKEARICADALSAAIQSRDDEMARLLLEHGLTLTVETLHQACAAGLEETVRMLLVNGIDVNSDDGTSAHPLHVAACHSYPTVVQLLIDRGADVNLRSTKYGSPLIAALEGCLAPFLRARSQPEPCRSLAKALPLPGPKYEIYISGGRESQARPGYKEVSQCEQIVQSLFDHGAEVDTDIRSFGNTLHLASCMGSETIVRHVLKRISDVNVFGGYFGSPLLAALEGNHLVIVELLLGRGIDVNHPSSEHGTALHYVCAHGTTKSVQMLLDHGADVNAYDEEHGSPLAAAASTGNDTFPRNKTRSSAESRAIVELLLRHGDKVQIRECDLLAAASCWSSADGEYYMRLFLEHDQSARATEPVIVQAIANPGGYSSRFRTLPRLLERDGGLGTTPTMLKAAKEPEVMRMLLEHKPVCELTAEILEAAAERYGDHFELVKLLLAHNPKIPITEAAVMAALGHKYSRGSDGNLLELLFGCNSELEITEAMLKAARKTPDMKLLLERRRKELPISSEVLEAVASCYRESGALVCLLLEHDKSIKITPPVVQRAITYCHDSESLIETLLEHDPNLEIDQEQLLSMIKGHGGHRGHKGERQIVELLVKHGKTLDFTPEVSVALDEKYQSHSDKDMKELFYKLKRQDTS